MAVYLTTRQIIWCWPLGMVSVTLYALVFYKPSCMPTWGLQGLYFALAIYGWWAWLHGGEDHGELEVSLTSNRARIVLAAIGDAGRDPPRDQTSEPLHRRLAAVHGLGAHLLQHRRPVDADPKAARGLAGVAGGGRLLRRHVPVQGALPDRRAVRGLSGPRRSGLCRVASIDGRDRSSQPETEVA